MKLPRGDQYNMAVQNPNFCFSDSDLKLSTVQTNNLGLPIPYSGGFTTTYKVRNGNFSWAVRCFTREVDHLQKRYQAIDEFIEKTGCDYLVEARYLKHGIQVNNEWSSIIKMHWIEGDLFNVHLGKIINNKEEIESILEKFVDLVGKLRKDKISHGDLQHGNIIIKNDRLFLIDYDGMFLPEITTVGTGEVGHPNYQHPKRSADYFDGNLDNFSSIVIYLALRAIAIKPELWKKYNNAENILFKKEDFSDPLNSELFFDLSKIEELHYLVNNLVHVCLSDFSKIPNLKDFITDKSKGVKIAINSPKQKQAQNTNDFFGDLYKDKAKNATGGFQYKPTHTLPDFGVTGNKTTPTYTSSSNISNNNPGGKSESILPENIKVIVFWIVTVGILLFLGYHDFNTTPTTTIDNNVTGFRPYDTSCSDGVKDSTGVCITRDENCQNTNGVNSYWDGSYCNCKNYTIWNKSKTKCVTMLEYCRGINGINATYNESDNTCGCATGYEFRDGVCALPKTGYQVCSDMNATWDGYSYTDGGGYNCTCNTGYVTSFDKKSCVIAPVSTNDQKCAEDFVNSRWSGEYNASGGYTCNCKPGYYWDINEDGVGGGCFTKTALDQSCNKSNPGTSWDGTYNSNTGIYNCD